MPKSIHMAATARSTGKVFHIVPNGNLHARCGVIAPNEAFGIGVGTKCAAGTHSLCKNCIRVAAPRDLNPAPTRTVTDMWTVTNKAGDEITRFEAARTEDAAERIRVDADCRDWFRLEGGVFRRRLYSDEL